MKILMFLVLLCGCAPLDGYQNYNIFTGYEEVAK
jgi:hypothetical protein